MCMTVWLYVCMYVWLYVCMHVYYVCAWCLRRSERIFSPLEMGSLDGCGCEAHFGCWELNSGPLEEEHVLLNNQATTLALGIALVLKLSTELYIENTGASS